MLKKILITGGSGFIGKSLVQTILRQADVWLNLALRSGCDAYASVDKVTVFQIKGLDATTDWSAAVSECDLVIHIAARAHMPSRDASQNMLYQQINTDATLNLARQAAAAKVKRFIFLSSIKVNGEGGDCIRYRPEDRPNPVGAYAVSKFKAEQGLLDMGHNGDLEVVILRPTLVYGPGVKGNFGNLLYWVRRGLPLPFKYINNKRNFVSIYNLIDVILLCIDNHKAINEVFLVSDGEDVSIAELVQHMAQMMHRKARLFYIPPNLLVNIARLFNQQAALQKLCGSLRVDISKTCELLEWTPKQHLF